MEMMAAMVTLVRSSIERAHASTGLGKIDEVSVVQADRLRLLCRHSWAREEEPVLAVVAPPCQMYRRLTSRAIAWNKRVWRT
jgi:hypothetical protein